MPSWSQSSLKLGSPLVLALGLAAGLSYPSPGPATESQGPGPVEQMPEVAPSQVRGEPTKPQAAPAPLGGPNPSWIWGASPDQKWFLRTSFEGGSRAARLVASADNVLTVWLNGQKLGGTKEWAEPVDLNVQKAIKPGKNELVAEVSNEGSLAGLVLKLALTMPDGTTRYVISDASWTASAKADGAGAAPVKVVGKLGDAPWGDVIAKAETRASGDRGVFQVPPGFQVERIFQVPRDTMGSWVALTTDPKGRLIASDQENKGLYRITPAPIGSDKPTVVERLPIDISAAQGLLFAFDSLYLSVNGGPGSGLYRARDKDGDDRYEELVKLSEIRGGGEHGPHALRLSPDGKSIIVVAGNHTLPPENVSPNSPVPTNWQEDHLLPRQWDANGHARGILAPGGWIARTDPDGKTWEVITAGYRNSYDADFNADGELFVYDSDMEWDMGSPWYRPTRVSHSPLGSEFGWRSGTGKFPTVYPDTLPPLVEIGPGSPVGVSFGYGTKFPAKYQKALFICDWTFGTIYAIHTEPDGSSYKGTKEEFLSRTPLPLTDITVGKDGALYFTIGGRGLESELYRVTYVGNESTAPVDAHDAKGAAERAARHKIESYQRTCEDPAAAVAAVYPALKSPDRFLRNAARVALEHQPPALWQDKVLAETDPEALIAGAVALARQGDKAIQPKLLQALGRLDFAKLPELQQQGLLRAYSLAFIRMGRPDDATCAALAAKLDPSYPGASDLLNRELCNMLVYLKSPTVIAKTIDLMKQPLNRKGPEMSGLLARNASYGGSIAKMLENLPDAQKIHYAFALRNASTGWTLEQRKFYFDFLNQAREWSGGASYPGFIRNIDNEAFENASEQERLAIEATGARKPYRVAELPRPQGPGKTWTLDELNALGSQPLAGRNFERGKKTYAAARCVLCHRFAGDGGATGPELTQVAGRFGFKELAEAMIDPNKAVSDQYRASVVATDDGKVYTGRIVSETPKSVTIVVDPEDATKIAEIPRSAIEEIRPATDSLMPAELLNTLNQDEVLDLMAFLLSRGDPSDRVFKKP